MRTEIKTAIICGVVIFVGIGIISIFYSELDIKNNMTNGLQIHNTDTLLKAPNMLGATGFINILENEIEAKIKDKVVLYDIWTYSCINCIRTLPHITAWDEKYRNDGLLIIGIHTPEFEFEKDQNNVETAVNKFRINYPVILDNEKEIWNSFENKYWPRKYIADHNGYIRYDHIGEGSYQETEKVIQQLLQERSNSLGTAIDNLELTILNEFEHSINRTPEIYLGYKFAVGRDNLGNEQGFIPNKIVEYKVPLEKKQNYFYLDGIWHNTKDSMKLVSEDGLIVLKYTAKQVNIVASNNAELEIFLNGKNIPDYMRGSDLTSDNKIIINNPQLYNIIDSDITESHELIIKANKPNLEVFTFTFG